MQIFKRKKDSEKAEDKDKIKQQKSKAFFEVETNAKTSNKSDPNNFVFI